jgi:hypothetical protein
MPKNTSKVDERYSLQTSPGVIRLPHANPSKKRHRKGDHAPDVMMYGPNFADRPRLSTPDPRSPGIPSSALTPVLITDASPTTTAYSATTVLTVPDDKDEDDGLVSSVTVVDPFSCTTSHTTLRVPGIGHSSMFAHPSDTERDDICEGLGSVDLGYSPTILSQGQDDDRDQPPAKRRKTKPADTTPRVIMVQDAAKVALRSEHNEDQAMEEADDSAASHYSTGQMKSPGEDDSIETPDKPGHHEEVDPIADTDSNWDHLEAVQDRLQEYNAFKTTIKGYDSWTPAQAKLHKLLALRGCWPMFQHSWALAFSIRNIYPQVFAPPQHGSGKRVAIRARRNEFRATRALEAVFDLSSLVCSYRQSGAEDKIGGVLRRQLRRYVAWAAYDAGVEDRAYAPTMQVYEFDPRRWAARVRAAAAAAAAAKRTVSAGDAVEIKTEPASSDWGSDEEEGGEEDNDNEPVVDSDPISDEVERRLRRLAARHRQDLVTPESRHLLEHEWTYTEPPPLLFAFVIVQHMVMVVSLDPSRPDAEIVVFSELDMSLADQWLWNALAIALPVNMARDALWERRERMPVLERVDVDDPDA